MISNQAAGGFAASPTVPVDWDPFDYRIRAIPFAAANVDSDGWIRLRVQRALVIYEPALKAGCLTRNELYRPRMVELQAAESRRARPAPRPSAERTAAAARVVRPSARQARGPSWRRRSKARAAARARRTA